MYEIYVHVMSISIAIAIDIAPKSTNHTCACMFNVHCTLYIPHHWPEYDGPIIEIGGFD